MITVKDNYIYTMSAEHPPVLTVDSGAELCFETLDCFGGQVTSERSFDEAFDWDNVNPATGPVYINGAEPGDVLKLTIKDIEVGAQGVICISPGDGVLKDEIKEPQVKLIPVSNGTAKFTDTVTIPIDPMIGVIGVAPEEGSVECCEPGSHGSNMDNRRIRKGAVLYLPVFHPGALLAAGDVHAAMGDGEIGGSGIEIPAKITLTAEVVKGFALNNPLLEDDEFYYTIASEYTLDEAIHTCAADMAEILQQQLGLTLNEAGMLLSAAGDMKICQLVDPKITATLAVPKTVLQKIKM